jgi:hypothetical protein
MQKERKRILQYSWLPIGTYYKNLAIRKKFQQSLPNLAQFFA